MKILNKLTLKNLRMNKSRTIVTIIGILLSTALITVVAGMLTSGQQTIVNAQLMTSGDYDMTASYVTSQSLEDFAANRDVQSVYVSDEIGVANMQDAKNQYRPYIGIRGFDSNALKNCFTINITEGRLPQNDKELVLSQKLVDSTSHKYAIGDIIHLEVGNRVAENGSIIENTSNYGYDEMGQEISESVQNTSKQTYTIVGIMEDCVSDDVQYSDSSACATAITCIDKSNINKDTATAFVRFTDSAESDYVNAVSKLTGVSVDTINKIQNEQIHYEDVPTLEPNAQYTSFRINSQLLAYKGYGLGDVTMNMFLVIGLIVIGIIVFTSIFVIRNSFAISISEKTKLYGMLASVGTTSKQIRHNVLFEGFVLGVIGIPLGVLLGVGVCAILVVILNLLLGPSLNGLSFAYSVPLLPIAFAVVLSALTILVSTLAIAFRASKIAPITAIRGNNDVKLKNKKLKTPKYISKMFGVGGEIAHKNLKRSKKKYRTTVFSIIVSVALFITMSSFVQYGSMYSEQYFSNIEYNVGVNTTLGSTNNEMQKELQREFAQIRKLSDIKKDVYIRSAYFESEELCNSLIDKNSDLISQTDDGKNVMGTYVVSLGDRAYKEILQANNLNYDDLKDKGIIYHNNLLNVKDGTKINLRSIEDANQKVELTVGGSFTEMFDDFKYAHVSDCAVIVSDEFMDSLDIGTDFTLAMQTDAADNLEKSIKDLGFSDLNVTNYDSYVSQNNAIVLIIAIFIYGFIAVISLIGITNIFNTITTNMRLRSKEFAMLKSIGMTKKEFNRMIRLESLFYGTKSLIIGIPVGILGSFLILNAFNIGNAFAFAFPWMAIIISIVFVFAMVWLIMKFSISKVNKQNIIETIRNDNI